jgi:NAD(P)-dependent dehydrogenase (short-subunit alcohol dehydrogenase family)
MTAIVVGAGGTLGRACSELLVEGGWNVVAADLRAPDVVGARGVEVDVTDLASVQTLIADIETGQPVTALIYAAGVNFTGPVDATDWNQFERLIAVNLRGAFHFGAALQSALRQRPRAFASAFISSTAGLKGEAGGSIYCATKFGLRGFVESFAAEIAPLGGRANSVCPGNVDSPMLSQLAEQVGIREGKSTSDVLSEFAGASAFNRLISPREVAQVCTWLVSSESSGVSGQTLVVDGPTA